MHVYFSYASSDTSSYNSESHDDEEIALAIQAAELAARQEARSRFRSSTDLIHRLFVCISGKYLTIFNCVKALQKSSISYFLIFLSE